MKQFVLDIECYPNYFFVGIMEMESGKHIGFRNFENEVLDADGLLKILTHPDAEFITFNGNNYDFPMLMYALDGASNLQLKTASDRIIIEGLRSWEFYQKYGLNKPKLINHIDLIEVAPSMCSLKLYGGRMHTQKLQDLPIKPDTILSLRQANKIGAYCINDLVQTAELATELTPQIDLRRVMSETYGTDMRSKSDAQIAEAVLVSEYTRITGSKPPKTTIDYKSFKYQPPTYVKFRTEQLQEALDTITAADFIMKDTGHVQMPKEVSDLRIVMGKTTYKLGIGGLHSQESEQALFADEETILADIDVVSYYPNLMLNMGMSPPSFGEHFQSVYRNILEERIAAKKSGDMVKSNALKITLNGTFGKTSSKYSLLYSPTMMIHTTLTGQLSLLMLIEAMEGYGVPVRSANTDGIVMTIPVDKYDGQRVIVQAWEKHCGLEMEETPYNALYSRDVNNYIAIKPDGTVKTKGAYGKTGLMKNPQNVICSEAVQNYLTTGLEPEQTVRTCTDIRKFITLRTVNGGAVKDGYTLGKAIRWYYSTNCRGEEIVYRTNGNTVPRSMGARPIMDITESFPDDIDYAWYENECKEILMSVGAVERPPVIKLPRKNSKAWLALRDQGKIKEGRTPRDKWVMV
jgi:DNA polymerase elongation subunit (family B)